MNPSIMDVRFPRVVIRRGVQLSLMNNNIRDSNYLQKLLTNILD